MYRDVIIIPTRTCCKLMLYIVKKVQTISTDLRFQFSNDSYYHYRCSSVYYVAYV